MMSAKRTDGTIVFKESKPLSIGSGSTTQTLATSDDEYFYGGGTQNGRFSHKGKSINIKMKVDGRMDKFHLQIHSTGQIKVMVYYVILLKKVNMILLNQIVRISQQVMMKMNLMHITL